MNPFPSTFFTRPGQIITPHSGTPSPPAASDVVPFPPSDNYVFVSSDLADADSWYGAASVHIFTWTAPKTRWLMLFGPRSSGGWAQVNVWAGTESNVDYPDRTAASSDFNGDPLVSLRCTEDQPSNPPSMHPGAIWQAVEGTTYTIVMSCYDNSPGSWVSMQEWANSLRLLDGFGSIPPYQEIGSYRVQAWETPSFVGSRGAGVNVIAWKRDFYGVNHGYPLLGEFFVPRANTVGGATNWAMTASWTTGADPRAIYEWYPGYFTLAVTCLEDGTQMSIRSSDPAMLDTTFPVTTYWYEDDLMKYLDGSSNGLFGAATGVTWNGATKSLTLASGHSYVVSTNVNWEVRYSSRLWEEQLQGGPYG